MSIRTDLEKMIADLQGALEDADKADGGQKAAGTRIRTRLQDIRTRAQALRNLVMETRKNKD